MVGLSQSEGLGDEVVDIDDLLGLVIVAFQCEDVGGVLVDRLGLMPGKAEGKYNGLPVLLGLVVGLVQVEDVGLKLADLLGLLVDKPKVKTWK